MERKPHYYEKDLETALIEHLQQFLLDLGNGFSFVVRPTLLFIIPAGLSARGGFIRPWRIYPPVEDLSARGGFIRPWRIYPPEAE